MFRMNNFSFSLIINVCTMVLWIGSCTPGIIDTDNSNPDPTESPTPEPTPEPTPDPTPEPTPDPTPEPTPDPVDITTAYPSLIDDVLVNPGMGFADFHFGWYCNLPPISFTPQECANRVLANWPVNYPDSAVAYFRWLWKEIEPVRGRIDFDLIDTTIQSANLLGETLSIRILTMETSGIGVPDWILAEPYSLPGQWHETDSDTSVPDTWWPDYRHPSFQNEYARMMAALGQRYNGHPAIDHIDIGPVGCWGEWNTACLKSAGNIISIFDPQNAAEEQEILNAYKNLIDITMTAFPDTPVVMLGLSEPLELEVVLHAIEQGAGWRVDCWGDWGLWGSTWNHMEDLYPAMIADAAVRYPAFPDVWKQAPIQLEICATMPQWQAEAWTADQPDGKVYLSFQWALDQHASVLNAKSTDIPADYVPAMNEMLKKNGYRFVVEEFSHKTQVNPGDQTTFSSRWSNLGVAPSYNRRTLTYRLKNAGREVTFESVSDIRTWLPGSWGVSDRITIPADLPPDIYNIEVAILDRAGSDPFTAPLPPLYLGIDGRQPDGWYTISQLTVQ